MTKGNESITDIPKEGASPASLRAKGYFDLLSFIISNAVAGEIMAVENYSEMVHLMPDTQTKIETVQQAMDETKHIVLLQKLGKSLHFDVANRIVEPQWTNIRHCFSSAVRKRDLAACLIIQDMMTESMAIMLYKTLAGEAADTDPQTASVANTILQDELEHFEMGVNRIQQLLEKDTDKVHESLILAHRLVMPELFSMISTSCHCLCGELNIDCASLSLSSIRTNIDSIRIKAAERYIEALDTVGFNTAVTNRLVAEVSAYEIGKRMNVGLNNQPSCCPENPGAGCG